jgi:thymidylate kinase
MKFSVAIIGNDGSGKTTIANRLLEAQVFPSRYLYMGLSTLSSNMALPTSYLARIFKRREFEKRSAKKPETDKAQTTASHNLHHGGPKRGSVWKTLRFANRMVEALWRQFVSWMYQSRGFVVLYDRHYFFDAAPGAGTNLSKLHWTDRLEFKIFSDLYPKPSLVIFLDAPADVLFSRKGESNIKTLEKRREAIIRMSERLKDFIIVDATQPLDKVYEEVLNHILAYKH